MQQNFLSSLGFSFKLSRLPNTSFFIQSVNIPGVSIGIVDQPTPFKTLHLAGDKIEYDTFDVTIKMDEKLESFVEIYDWMKGLSHPEDFSQFKQLKDSQYSLYSDGTLLIFNSNSQPILEFSFSDMFPVSMSSISMDVSSAEPIFVTSSITFKHNGFKIKRLNG